MYAKALVPVPGTPGIPSLIGTTSSMDQLLQKLPAFGWSLYGTAPAPGARGILRITVEHRLQLDIDGIRILDGPNPVAPPGWYEAVDAFDGHCLVEILRTGDVDLTDPDCGTRMEELSDLPDAAGLTAILPLVHDAVR